MMSDHLDDVVFRRGPCEVQFAVWVAEFAQSGGGLMGPTQHTGPT